MSASSASVEVVEPAPAIGRVLLTGLLLAAAQAPLGSTLISVGLPSISRSLQVALPVATHWLVTSYLIVNIVGQGPGGRLTDALGQLRAVRAGMALQAFGGVLGVLGQTLPTLVLARCAIATGAALVMPATVAWLRDKTPEARRGRIFGLFGATMSLAAALGPPLGGVLLGSFGYRAIFAAPLVLWALSALLVRSAPRAPLPAAATDWKRLRGELDPLGSVLLTAALAALLLGGKTHANWAIAGFVSMGCIFVAYELRSARPMLDPRLFAQRNFAAGSAVIGLQNFVMYGLLFQLPNFFEHVRGSEPRAIGTALFAMMLATMVASTFGGRLCDRLGARSTALLGALPFAVGLWLLQQLSTLTRPSDALPGLALLGFGLGLLNAPAQTAALNSVPSQRSGQAAGATATVRYLGGVLSIFMLRLLLDAEGEAALHAHSVALRCFGVAALLLVGCCACLPGRSRPLQG